MMKVLVTGAAGFIGSTLVMRLLARGDRVVGIGTKFLEDFAGEGKFQILVAAPAGEQGGGGAARLDAVAAGLGDAVAGGGIVT